MVTTIFRTETNGSATRQENGRKFIYCPHCHRRGLYKVKYHYERCRYCGLYRVLLPGQDF